MLNTLYHYAQQIYIFIELADYINPTNVFHDAARPDWVLKRNHHFMVIELTSRFKTNLVHSGNLKIEQYKKIKRHSSATVNKNEALFLEVFSLSFGVKTFKPLEKFLLYRQYQP